MKHKLFIIMFTLLLLTQGYAQLLTENFDYTAGENVGDHGWTSVSGGTALTVGSPGLEYAGYALSGIGNAAIIPPASETVMKGFTSQTGGSLYVSFMVNGTNAEPSPGATCLYLGPTGTSIFNRFFSFYISKVSDTEVQYGVCKEGGIDYAVTNQLFGTTCLIVMQYQFNTGSANDDVVSIWVNPPTDGTIPAADGSTSSGNDAVELAEIIFGAYSGNTAAVVDGIRVCTAWPLGSTTVPGEMAGGIPESLTLFQNHPNPFNPRTTIRYSLPAPAEVSLVIYDSTGRIVGRPVNGLKQAGEHTFDWSAGDLPSGVYFCRIAAGNASRTMKMLLMK
jgi:hypothetical protein